jgi:di-heme oxidoreductase (putative peroxidase)
VRGWRYLVVIALLAVVVAIAAIRSRRTADEWQPARASSAPDVQLGAARSDLEPRQLELFHAGQKLFVEVRPEVGPLYFGTSCVGCHNSPTIGGEGGFDIEGFIGQHSDNEGTDTQGYPAFALPGFTRPTPPPNAARRVAPPLFGLGLVERIPDATIRAACGTGHFQAAKRYGTDPPNEVARFGQKPYLGTIPDFLGDMLRGAMSLTNPIDNSSDEDAFPDPEVDRAYMETLSSFVRGLAAPARQGSDPPGEAAFHAFGCATCHVPDMPPAFGVFSDFCLHGMGDKLADGIKEHSARGDEFRTMRLWGLRFRQRYLHDGRATTLEAAIEAHGGEAGDAADAYRSAPDEQRAALLRFLRTL